jgi:hypothetical protein
MDKAWMKALNPKLYLIGLFTGFIFCTGLGHLIAGQRLPIPDFARFYYYVNPDGGFYPTFRQLLAQAQATEEQDRQATLVIVGGDSVFFGEGQSAKDIWTKYLEAELNKVPGKKYKVVNLAMPGMKAFEAGFWVFEHLHRKMPKGKVLFVTNALPINFIEPIGTRPAAYLYHQARVGGFIPAVKERENYVQKHADLTVADASDQETFFLQAWINHLFADEELWTRFTYSVMGSYYHRSTDYKSLLPRRLFKDPEVNRSAFAGIGCEHLEIGVQGIIRWIDALDYPVLKHKRQERLIFFDRLKYASLASVDEELRGDTLVFVSSISPFYLSQMGERYRSEYVKVKRDWISVLKQCGFRASALNETLKEDDYVDYDHLTVSGGKAMACAVAAEILKGASNAAR